MLEGGSRGEGAVRGDWGDPEDPERGGDGSATHTLSFKLRTQSHTSQRGLWSWGSPEARDPGELNWSLSEKGVGGERKRAHKRMWNGPPRMVCPKERRAPTRKMSVIWGEAGKT